MNTTPIDVIVGADPEVFLKNDKGQHMAACGAIPGTKEKPYKVPAGAVQVDGTAAEFNIDPAATSGQFITNVQMVMKSLSAFAREHALTIDVVPVVHYPEEYLRTLDPSALELGCDPDYNAWTEEMNPMPEPHPTRRTAGGHVHLGWCNDRDPLDPAHFASCIAMIKQMDYYLGIPSVIHDENGERREMYGKAGAFRPKPYGSEYRSMSNFWIRDNKLMKMVFENAQLGFNLLANKGVRVFEKYGNVAQDIINNSKRDDAVALAKELKLKV